LNPPPSPDQKGKLASGVELRNVEKGVVGAEDPTIRERSIALYDLRKESELNQLFSDVDFTLLNGMIQQIVRNAGLIEAHIVLPEHIKPSKEAGHTACYDYKNRMIEINESMLHKEARDLNLDFTLYKILTLIHEEIHAATHSMDSKENVGYHNIRSDLFRAFNEGVTELLARDIFSAYALYKLSATKTEINEFLRRLRLSLKNKIIGSYGDEIEFVEAFRDILARNNVDPKIVWSAIVHDMFRGATWNDPEFIAEFEKDILPPGFLDKLGRVDQKSKVRLITKELRKEGLFRFKPKSKFLKNLIERIEKFKSGGWKYWDKEVPL
jgi:hypothetical protein